VPCRIIVFSGRKGEKAPRENPPNCVIFVFSHGDLSPRHTKVRHFSCVPFSPPVCCIFAWRGESPPKSPFGVFSRGDLSPRQAKIRQTGAKTRKVATRKPAITFWRVFAWRPFAFSPRKHVYTTWHKSATILLHNCY